MRRLIAAMSVLIISTLISFGQIRGVPIDAQAVRDLYLSLKKSVNTSWIRENPVLSETKPSFFNSDNQAHYFVGLLQMSGHSFPFTRDHTFSVLQFLLALDSSINIKQGSDADKVLKGTKVSWNQKIYGLLWFDDAIHKAEVHNWHLFEMTECPGTIIFPLLMFKKVKDVPNALTNNIQGLTIFPYDERITKIISSEAHITTRDEQKIKGVGYDVNNDNIFDIFTYDEDIDDTTSYSRLYINVSGHWECRWIRLDEDCV